jgi:hypothetical protein
MVNVNNSYKRRIFINHFTDEVLSLKKNVENKIKEIEEQGNDYNLLNEYEDDQNAKHLSIYKYKESITIKIDEIIENNNLNENLENELNSIKEHIYLILIGSFDNMKNFLTSKINTQLVHRTDNDKTEDFKKYQKLFEDLYKNELSTSSFKKSFFDIFHDVNVCPYCNRNFINPIYKTERLGNDNEKQAPDIEHFYPKSIYPFLSLSISNLLPSCTFCNKIKSDYDTYNTFKSPYEITEKDISFKFEPLDNQKRLIKLQSNLKNVEVLNLDDLYTNVHSKYINDIFLDINKNPLENRKYLKKFFSLSLDSQDKIYKKKFCNYYQEKDFNKQPLSKMTKDLFFHIKENEVK